MIDWNVVFATLPDEFTLDTLSAHETASERPRGYLRQFGCTLVEGGSNQAHRPGHVPKKAKLKETARADIRTPGGAVLVLKPLAIRLR